MHSNFFFFFIYYYFMINSRSKKKKKDGNFFSVQPQPNYIDISFSQVCFFHYNLAIMLCRYEHL